MSPVPRCTHLGFTSCVTSSGTAWGRGGRNPGKGDPGVQHVCVGHSVGGVEAPNTRLACKNLGLSWHKGPCRDSCPQQEYGEVARCLGNIISYNKEDNVDAPHLLLLVVRNDVPQASCDLPVFLLGAAVQAWHDSPRFLHMPTWCWALLAPPQWPTQTC